MTRSKATAEPDDAFRCESCDRRWYYTRPFCPDCGSEAVTTYSLGTGELLATTTVRVTPEDVREPNELGLVRFDSGVQAIAQLGDPALSVGDDVAFAGEHVLRGEGAEAVRGPRLVATDDRKKASER